MPIYEYKCKICDERFEVFVFSFENSNIKCPSCGSEETSKLLSSFASNGGSDTGGSSCNAGGFS